MKRALANIQTLTVALKVLKVDLVDIQKTLDEITKSHAAFTSFAELLNPTGRYFPSLLTAPEKYNPREIVHMKDGRKITAELRYAELNFLALAYDMAQTVRGDSRRAFRG